MGSSILIMYAKVCLVVLLAVLACSQASYPVRRLTPYAPKQLVDPEPQCGFTEVLACAGEVGGAFFDCSSFANILDCINDVLGASNCIDCVCDVLSYLGLMDC